MENKDMSATFKMTGKLTLWECPASTACYICVWQMQQKQAWKNENVAKCSWIWILLAHDEVTTIRTNGFSE